MATQKYLNTDESGMGEYADKPGQRSRVIGGTQSKAGAGRSGGQGGPTAKELADYERKKDAGVYTIEKGMPPSPREMAKGGSASSRADGCATKGKTRGTMITMKGGGYAC